MFEAITVFVSRFMNVTLALRISPGFASAPSTALISLTVALSVTVAELDVADEVEAKQAPVK